MMMKLFIFSVIFVSLNVVNAYTVQQQNQRVLIIGGSRFTGISLWKELCDRGHDVTVYNRGKTPLKPLGKCGQHMENKFQFDARIRDTKFIQGDRQDPAQMRAKIDPNQYDYVYDMNARSLEDTKPLAELFVGTLRV